MSILKEMLQFKVESINKLGLDKRHMAIERFILEYGVYKTGMSYPKRLKRGKIKQCFKNANALVFRNPDLTYYEGFAGRPELPIEFRHAWVVDPVGNVLDPTWRNTSDQDEYLGVPIPRSLLEENMLATEYYSVFWTGLCETPNFAMVERLKKMLLEEPMLKPA